MFNLYRTLFAAIFIALPILIRGQSNFTDLLYKTFGFYNHSTPLLTEGNLTQLFHKVLDGHSYNTQVTFCEDESCPANTCYSSLVNNNGSSFLAREDFSSACPRILYALTQDCIKTDIPHSEDEHTNEKPSAIEVWGYGLLFVTLINLCSLAGIFVLPLMKKDFYATILMFLIALAVGSLAANGILVLIPEAFEIVEMEGYTWKACTIVGGVYLFFVTERILKMITEYFVEKRHETSEVAHTDVVATIPTQTFVDIDNPIHSQFIQNGEIRVEQSSHMLLEAEQTNAGNGDVKLNGNGHLNLPDEDKITPKKKPVATVAWMIIFGDAFHNFIDGLSIGAAFSDSVLLGVSICIAVLCEELPHELGDFAILLNAGVTKKKALLFNFLSACTCYLGLIIGITLSEIADATPWILALAGGMFLYISLADMMPEMNRAAEEHKDKPFTVFFIQNLGFLCGFGVILLVSHFGAEIVL